MENAIGWYHSHPGYGCWLSGIDVSTQMLNQQYQEPWVAVVVSTMQIPYIRCLFTHPYVYIRLIPIVPCLPARSKSGPLEHIQRYICIHVRLYQHSHL